MTALDIANTDSIVRRDLAGWLRVSLAEVDDAMQEAWLRYTIHADRLDPVSVRGWLWTVARNEYYRQYKARRREQPIDELRDVGVEIDLAEIIDFRDAVARLRGAEQYGVTYRLLGLSHDQVHHATLFTKRSIERHIRRGYAAMREELAA